ncbi:hypothetical protein OH492_23040 [Vibrio chagasii]|nr:hypothetical protein [Vibrio chagasii]
MTKPYELLVDYLGRQVNLYYTDERYVLTGNKSILMN